MNIDYEKLRSDLKDYYGTAMAGPFPVAVIDVSKVERASEEELVLIAQKEHFNLDAYTCDKQNQKNYRYF